MLEGPAYYNFKKKMETDLIEVIVRFAIKEHHDWIHTETSNINGHNYQVKTCF